jgi:hypothetical protein
VKPLSPAGAANWRAGRLLALLLCRGFCLLQRLCRLFARLQRLLLLFQLALQLLLLRAEGSASAGK